MHSSFFLILLTALALFLSGCVHRLSRPEPEVKTAIYSFVSGQATFIGISGKTFSSDQKDTDGTYRIDAMVLIPAKYFRDIEEKNQHCEAWR